MDPALSRGMTDVAVVNAAALPVRLPPEGQALPARCNDDAAGRRAAGGGGQGAREPADHRPREGRQGSFAGTDKEKTEFAAPRGGELDIPPLVALLKAGGHEAMIIQADQDATAGMIHRILRSASAAGADDVLFAVKEERGYRRCCASPVMGTKRTGIDGSSRKPVSVRTMTRSSW